MATRKMVQLPSGDMMFIGPAEPEPTVEPPTLAERQAADPVAAAEASREVAPGLIECPWCGQRLATDDVRGHVVAQHSQAIGHEADEGRSRALEAARTRGHKFNKVRV